MACTPDSQSDHTLVSRCWLARSRTLSIVMSRTILVHALATDTGVRPPLRCLPERTPFVVRP